MSEHVELCNCPECKRGLWCADGERGQFVRGVDDCKRCSVIAWKHSSKAPRGASA